MVRNFSNAIRARSAILFALLVVCFAVLPASVSQAEMIGNLIGVQQAYPDLCSGGIAIDYSIIGDTGTFIASGDMTDYSPDDEESDYYVYGSGAEPFYLEATLSPTANTPMLVSGTVSLSGEIYDQDFNLLYFGTLLTGSLVEFGSSMNDTIGPDSTVFDFRFLVTGGELANAYGGAGVGYAGIMLTPWYNSANDTPFTGGFQTGFTFYYGDADTVPMGAVPEPSSSALALGAMAVFFAGVWRRRFWMKRGVEN